MKVGVFLDSYLPSDGGGYTMQTELFRALCRVHKQSEHGFVVISQSDRDIAEECETAGLPWMADRRPGPMERLGALVARTWPNMRGNLKWRSSFERKIRQAGVDFVWFLGPRPRTVDLPYLTIVLDLQHRLHPWFPEVSEYGEWELRETRLAPFLQRAAGIIAGTQAGKEEIARYYQVPGDRVHLLPHPVPGYLESVSGNGGSLQKLGINPGFLFYPAQFWAHKNHVNLLLAIRLLADEGVKIPLVLVGSDFGNQAFIEQQIQDLGLNDQVKIIGFVERADLVSLYKHALALTYVSFFGPENLPPLEAFAMGCPVIAAKVSGADEQIGDAALLVDPKSPLEIAAAIRRVYEDNGLRTELIAKGRKRATRWTTEDFVLGVFKILDGFEPIRHNWGN
jgi:glycosyltransferase involved in cell wall biosynthesis